MKRACSNSAHLAVLAVLACSWCGQLPRVASAQERGPQSGGFVAELTPDMVALVKQQEADERRLTIREANLFHRHFIDTCMEVMPTEVTFGYCGLLATDNGRHPLRTYGNVIDIGLPLHWGVGRGQLGVFGFWISTQRTKQTLAKCKLEGRELFVNVDFVTGNQSVDAKLPELGGRSVREVLKHIEKPGPKPGLPEDIKPLPAPDDGSPDKPPHSGAASEENAARRVPRRTSWPFSPRPGWPAGLRGRGGRRIR
jgi:hypothetical protein